MGEVGVAGGGVQRGGGALGARVAAGAVGGGLRARARLHARAPAHALGAPHVHARARAPRTYTFYIFIVALLRHRFEKPLSDSNIFIHRIYYRFKRY